MAHTRKFIAVDYRNRRRLPLQARRLQSRRERPKRAKHYQLSATSDIAGAGDRAFRNCVAKIVAARYGVKRSQIFTTSRRKETMRARHALVVILRSAGLPPTIVGKLIERDRSTALSSMRRAEALWRHDRHWRMSFSNVCRDIIDNGVQTKFGVKLRIPWPVNESSHHPRHGEANADSN